MNATTEIKNLNIADKPMAKRYALLLWKLHEVFRVEKIHHESF
jgi:hypothetical protein